MVLELIESWVISTPVVSWIFTRDGATALLGSGLLATAFTTFLNGRRAKIAQEEQWKQEQRASIGQLIGICQETYDQFRIFLQGESLQKDRAAAQAKLKSIQNSIHRINSSLAVASLTVRDRHIIVAIETLLRALDHSARQIKEYDNIFIPPLSTEKSKSEKQWRENLLDDMEIAISAATNIAAQRLRGIPNVRATKKFRKEHDRLVKKALQGDRREKYQQLRRGLNVLLPWDKPTKERET